MTDISWCCTCCFGIACIAIYHLDQVSLVMLVFHEGQETIGSRNLTKTKREVLGGHHQPVSHVYHKAS